jgi:hypothetical protein
VILVSFWIVSDRTFKPSCIYFPHFWHFQIAMWNCVQHLS